MSIKMYFMIIVDKALLVGLLSLIVMNIENGGVTGSFDRALIGPFRRNFGNSLDQCLNPIQHPPNFCTSQNVPHDAPTSFVRYRTINGTCNNLRRGKATFGAAGIVAARFLPHRGARYFDVHVFRNGNGLDTPLGHPLLDNRTISRFGLSKFPSAQDISDIVFNINNTDNGNNGRVPHLFMTFGQFMDHDFAYVIHPSSSSSGCQRRCIPRHRDYDNLCFPIRRGGSSEMDCVSLVRSFPVCQPAGRRVIREQISNITSYVDGSNIYGINITAPLVRDGNSPFLRVQNTRVGQLLPFQPSDEPCNERGGCFVAGDTRVNENTALAAMHTVWVRLHNFYAREIIKAAKNRPGTFPTLQPNNRDRNIIIFEEARKIVIAILQHIFYYEWLPIIVDVPHYKGYNPSIRPDIKQAFVTAAFRFGHTLVRNRFERVNSHFSPSREGPLTVQEAFNNNRPILNSGIEPIMQGLFGNNADAEDFDNTFSASIGETLFVPPRQRGFENLLALNIQRGRDHGLRSYREYRQDVCGIPEARVPRGSRNPFDIFRNTITNPQIRRDLWKAYGSPDNHIDLFAAGISETNDGDKLLGRTFGCILRKTFEDLREGDRFYYENRDVVTLPQQREVRKMTMARVMCLTLRNVRRNTPLRRIQRNLFRVFNPRKESRVSCASLLDNSLNVEQWLINSKIRI